MVAEEKKGGMIFLIKPYHEIMKENEK